MKMKVSFVLSLVFGAISGLFFNNIQDFVGMLTLREAVDYYAEVHLSYWNSLFHTFFMPVTMYGMFTWVPALLGLTPYKASLMRIYISMVYIFHYARISIITTLFIVLIYSYPFLRSHRDYSKTYRLSKSNKHNFIRGVVLSFGALFIQEIFGHYVGGDDASRLEGVPNAIVYAPYYSISHLFSYKLNFINVFNNVFVFFCLLVFIEYFDRLLNKYFRLILPILLDFGYFVASKIFDYGR